MREPGGCDSAAQCEQRGAMHPTERAAPARPAATARSRSNPEADDGRSRPQLRNRAPARLRAEHRQARAQLPNEDCCEPGQHAGATRNTKLAARRSANGPRSVRTPSMTSKQRQQIAARYVRPGRIPTGPERSRNNARSTDFRGTWWPERCAASGRVELGCHDRHVQPPPGSINSRKPHISTLNMTKYTAALAPARLGTPPAAAARAPLSAQPGTPRSN